MWEENISYYTANEFMLIRKLFRNVLNLLTIILLFKTKINGFQSLIQYLINYWD